MATITKIRANEKRKKETKILFAVLLAITVINMVNIAMMLF